MPLSFIFGKGQQYETPEELAKARAAANSLLADQPTPTDLGSGLNAIGRALLYRSMMGDIAASEKAGRDSAAAAFNPIAGALSGPGAFPPPPGGSSKVAQALVGKPASKPDNPNLPSRLDFARADAARTAGGLPDMPTMESYIRQSAAQRGIDPDVAVRVARSEGLQRGTWQSNVTRNGAREPSYGPFQLLVGGKGTGFPEGVGNRFIDATGLDPADPANWQQGIDFALDTAGKHGWGQWYGSKAVGISPFQGIGARAAPATNVGAAGQSGTRQVADSAIETAATQAPHALPTAGARQDHPISEVSQAGQHPAAQSNLPAQGAQAEQFDLSRLPAAAGGIADTFDASKGSTLPLLLNALQNPWLNETQRGLAKREIERLTGQRQQEQPRDPTLLDVPKRPEALEILKMSREELEAIANGNR
ncbi:hypothetical protein [Mesorhizobium sp. 1M-11]|uniref:hypothetical protein n=1 Tax=Mesorhizobium sp. 1M-11 TaxID=1529006 RepID=UPI0006C761B2|nr:hypothetical protein [Mesorhizobium sp. 1M-11]